MKLSKRELDLLANIGRNQKQKVKGLIGAVIALASYFVLRYLGVLDGIDIPFDSLMFVYIAFHIGYTFSGIRPEDRYVELLRRYVNNDAEAVSALSERKLQDT